MNDLSQGQDEQEMEFLRLQVVEQQHIIDDLTMVSYFVIPHIYAESISFADDVMLVSHSSS